MRLVLAALIGGGVATAVRGLLLVVRSLHGRYTVDPVRGIITHRIEGSLWPSWRNTVQERPYEIRKDTLFLGDQVRSRRVLVRVR